MTKIAKMRKVNVDASLKRRLSAAICLLLVSTVMLVTTTYAWYTISTAPEAKGIGSSVTGNGSLEVALVPSDGDIANIGSGRGTSGQYGGGNLAITASNITWGNLVSLIDPSYGLTNVTLTPVNGEFSTQTGFTFGTPIFGYDGRISELSNGSAIIRAYNEDEGKFNTAANASYGVRGVVETEDAATAFGYVIDLALRVNAANVGNDGTATDAKLILQQNGIQRIYSDAENASVSPVTAGGGSYLQFTNTPANLRDGLRIAFVQNYGNAADDATQAILAYGKAGTPDADGKCPIALYSNKACTTAVEENVLVDAMAKNTVYQISVIVWLDGANATNADFSATTTGTVKLNLQFATDVALIPMTDIDVKNNPVGGKGVITNVLSARQALYETIAAKAATERTLAESTFMMGYALLKGRYDNGQLDNVSYEEAVQAKDLVDQYAEAAIASQTQNP
jgi:hypothetical protein